MLLHACIENFKPAGIMHLGETGLWSKLHEQQPRCHGDIQQLPHLAGSICAKTVRRAAPSANNTAHAIRRPSLGAVGRLCKAEQLEGPHAQPLLQHDQRGRTLAAGQIQLVGLRIPMPQASPCYMNPDLHLAIPWQAFHCNKIKMQTLSNQLILRAGPPACVSGSVKGVNQP